MGKYGEDESLYKPRVEMLSPYKVTQEMMSKTGKDSTLFMHCLPSFHDFETTVAKTKHEEGIDIREVEDEVFRSKNSVDFWWSWNRMHTIKAVMVATLEKMLRHLFLNFVSFLSKLFNFVLW